MTTENRITEITREMNDCEAAVRCIAAIWKEYYKGRFRAPHIEQITDEIKDYGKRLTMEALKIATENGIDLENE